MPDATGALPPSLSVERISPDDLAIERLIAFSLCFTGQHVEERDGSCSCGFCAWSADHVLVMCVREGAGDMRWTDARRDRLAAEPTR